jgi:hypothetical protein
MMFPSFTRILSLILLTLLPQPAWAQDAEVPKPGGHLFILSGQSNMTGNLKQGESDAMRDLGAAYERSFTTLVGNLKKELAIGEMRFVIGRISDHGLHGDQAEGWKKIRAIQQKIAEDDPLGGWIDTDDLNGGDETKPQGDIHYPGGQAVILGERFARAALKQLGVAVPE